MALNKTIVISVNKSWNIYNFRLNLARTLKSKGYHIILIAPRDEYTSLLEKEFLYYPIALNDKGTNPFEDLKTLWEYYRLYRDLCPEIALHFTIKPNIYGNLAIKLLRMKSGKKIDIKVINNITGLGSVFIKTSWTTQIVKAMYRIVFKKTNKVFFQNLDDRSYFINHQLVDNRKVEVLPGSGVDTKRFFPRKKLGERFTFLLISRPLWDKGIQEYVDAIKILKKKYTDIRFQLLGWTEVTTSTKIDIGKDQIQKWMDAGYIEYLGKSDRTENWIANSDCVVLPSYREGIPRSLQEASSMEKPIITTDTIGCRNVVENGVTGYLCKLKDHCDLAKKMEKMLKLSMKERQKMGQAGRKKMIREFDEKIVIQKYLNTIDSLLL